MFFLAAMPCYSEQDGLSTKLVTFFSENKEMPTHQAWVLYFNSDNGSLNAIIDGESVTAIRTAMASAVATKHLANPNSKILAILGAGVQARSHYKAMKLLQSYDEVRIWNRTESRGQALANELGARACSTVEEAVKDADIICTTTPSHTAILQGKWVKQGVHINAIGSCRPHWQELDADGLGLGLPYCAVAERAVGSCRPHWQELDAELMQSAVVYCDTKEACIKEAGDVVISGCDIYAEIGEVINGEKQAFWEKTTVFESVGMGVEDLVSAKLIYDSYKKKLAEEGSTLEQTDEKK